MADHLRLHFSSQEASDEEVLAIYPAAIRRRILRHLYMANLRRCYLFQVERGGSWPARTHDCTDIHTYGC